MEYKRFGDTIVLKLSRGEEIVSSVIGACEKEKVTLASVEGIGAACSVKAGYFDTETKKYYLREYKGNLEILSLSGNITKKDGVYAHLHVSFAKEDGSVWGGHLNEAVIGGAGEIFIRAEKGTVGRMFDESSGLNVLRF